MPTAALRPCRICRTVGCTEHIPKAWQSTRVAPAKRVTGRPLQRLRQQLFDREPLCRPCHTNGRVTVATIRDHIVPLAEGGQDVELNTQPICAECHDAKTQAESARGIRRWGA